MTSARSLKTLLSFLLCLACFSPAAQGANSTTDIDGLIENDNATREADLLNRSKTDKQTDIEMVRTREQQRSTIQTYVTDSSKEKSIATYLDLAKKALAANDCVGVRTHTGSAIGIGASDQYMTMFSDMQKECDSAIKASKQCTDTSTYCATGEKQESDKDIIAERSMMMAHNELAAVLQKKTRNCSKVAEYVRNANKLKSKSNKKLTELGEQILERCASASGKTTK